ncbi:MAG: FG-GAP-like repeat-containing protein [Steroidobacter sp.]
MKKQWLWIGVVGLLSQFSTVYASTSWSAQDYDLYPGDFNGDGKTDILYVAKDPSKLSGIALSDGTAPNINWQSWTSSFLNVLWSNNQYNVIVADFNGDGKADIFLQSSTPGDNYLLFTDSTGRVAGISQVVSNSALGLVWSSDQHKIIAGNFCGGARAGLFLQAVSSSGADAIVCSDTNGTFTSGPAQTWTDGFLGLDWSTQGANVYAGDFNGDGKTDLLVQAKPKFVSIGVDDIPIVIPTYPSNMNGVAFSQGGTSPFQLANVQTWSRMDKGVDWSPLTNTLVVGNFNSDIAADVIFQAKYSGQTSYLLFGNTSGAAFSTAPMAISANVTLTSDATRLIVGNFGGGGSGAGTYAQTLTAGGTNYVSSSVGATITFTTHNTNNFVATVRPQTSAGRTAGQFTVTPTGAASYNVPIWTPPGVREIEPHLALHYTSGGPDGPMGPGWALTGISMISRCGKTWTSSNGAPSSVALSTTDDYCLDGNRLIRTSGPQGADGSTYEPEIADFSQITAHGSQGNGPQYFYIKGKDGRFYEYGHSSDSRIYGLGNTTTPYAWVLNRVSDRQGNSMTFTYFSDSVARIQKINYTATNNGAAPYEVDFSYVARSGGTTISKYIAGALVNQSKQLSQITVNGPLYLSDGTPNGQGNIRQYQLSYDVSPTTNRPVLSAIQECAGSQGTDCLRPTRFTYQWGQAGVSSIGQMMQPPIVPSYGFTLADLDGDGIPDEIYGKYPPAGSTSISIYVRLGTGDGITFGPEISTGMSFPASGPEFLVGGFAGNGHQQILAPGPNNHWYAYDISSQPGDIGLPVDFASTYSVADWDGDGLPDLIATQHVSGFNTVYVVHNTSLGKGSVKFDNATSQVVFSASGAITSYAILNSQAFDFNGDGRADIIVSSTICSPPPNPNQTCSTTQNTILSKGYGVVPTTLVGAPPMNGVPGDWNGDGCTDILTVSAIFVSNCNGGFKQLLTGAPNPGNNIVPTAIDWDGDGLTDLVFRNSTTNTLWLIRSNGSDSAQPAVTNSNIYFVSSNPIYQSQVLVAMDLNADGLQDLVSYEANTTSGSSIVYPTIYVHDGVNTPPDLLNAVTDGFGITFAPTYLPITQSSVYTQDLLPPSWPEVRFRGAYYVVNNFSASDGTGGTYTNAFRYTGARMNMQGRGFEGFSTAVQTDSRTSIAKGKQFRQDFPFTGSVVGQSEAIESGSGFAQTSTFISATNTAYQSVTLANVPGINCSACYFPFVSSSTAYTYEPTGTKSQPNNAQIATTTTQYTYDSYGTPTDTKTTITDTDSTVPVSPFNTQKWITEIKNPAASIINDTTNWCLGRPTLSTTTKTLPDGTSQTRTVAHTMDPNGYNCRATTETVEPGNSLLQVVQKFEFDPAACGNTTKVTVIGQNPDGTPMDPRITSTMYGTNCEMPEQVTDAYQRTTYTKYRYDYVVPVSKKDPNGVSVSWTHDNFARKISETRPDGTSTITTYSDCVSNSCWGLSDLRFLVTDTLKDNSGATVRYGYKFYDGMDRLRATEGFSSTGVWTNQITVYDSLGRKYQDYLPYSAGSNGYHQYTYDPAGRQIRDDLYSSSNAIYRTVSVEYNGMTVAVTDPNGHKITKVSDVTGKTRWVTDDSSNGTVAGTTKYTYDPFGNLVTIVDATGKTSTYGYNIRGFKTSSQDADTGSWTFTPDSLNELVSETDANKKTTSFTYDLLGRMKTRTEPESSTPIYFTYGSDASLYNIGKLQQVTKPDGYAENYTYDSVGRPLSTTYTEDGNNYTFTYNYNNLGAVDTLQYPASTSGYRFTLKNVYNSYGFLNKEEDDATGAIFWTLNSTNDSNLPTEEMLGNGVLVNTGYTPWTNEVTSRQEGSGTSLNNLQDLSYQWDLTGNLHSRTDKRQNLTEVFTYDAMNRLKGSTLNGNTNLSMQYDASGNIINKSDVSSSNYVYGDPAHPHAVTQAGSWNMTYDANGNMITRAGGSVSWYSYNLPNTISYNGNSTQFFYNANHQRWKQVAHYGSTTEITHYIGGLLEVVQRGTQPAEYRHQIPAGSSTTIYTRRGDGTSSTYYATSDHLGSADLVLDGGGNVMARESFTPFGARRGSNWTGIPSSSDYAAFANTTRKGFTGHEMLDSVGLVHMNGRVYDPYLGRFMSADTVIQNLGATQSVNPYAYAWDNPLRYIDPSGHSLLGDIVGLVVAIVICVFAPELGLPALGAEGGMGVATAMVAGFFGSFIGTMISTGGDLSASFTAGIMGAVFAAAFYAAGTFTQAGGNFDGFTSKVLAHAAVGCVQAEFSGGNCGRGAMAAALSEAATVGGLVEQPRDLASWGTLRGTVEAGLVGGAASEITGGHFSDGFSTGAAGYLFNEEGHAVAEEGIDLSVKASIKDVIGMGFSQHDGVSYKVGDEFNVEMDQNGDATFSAEGDTWQVHVGDEIGGGLRSLWRKLTGFSMDVTVLQNGDLRLSGTYTFKRAFLGVSFGASYTTNPVTDVLENSGLLGRAARDLANWKNNIDAECTKDGC